MPIHQFVLTILGPDRPGLVGEISEAVAGANANWLESRMSHLAGHFAGIARVEADEDAAERMFDALEGIDPGSLHITIAESTPSAEPAKRIEFEVVGNDRPGIVADITRALAKFGANVEEMETTQESAAMSGDLHFRAKATVSVPNEQDLDALTRGVEDIADDLVVDFLD